MTAEPEAEPTPEEARAARIRAKVDAAPTPSKALLDRIYELIAPAGGRDA